MANNNHKLGTEIFNSTQQSFSRSRRSKVTMPNFLTKPAGTRSHPLQQTLNAVRESKNYTMTNFFDANRMKEVRGAGGSSSSGAGKGGVGSSGGLKRQRGAASGSSPSAAGAAHSKSEPSAPQASENSSNEGDDAEEKGNGGGHTHKKRRENLPSASVLVSLGCMT